MTKLSVGVDIGSVATKAACFNKGNILGTACISTGVNYRETIDKIIQELLSKLNMPANTPISYIACGYGRKMALNSAGTVNEMTANIKGVFHLVKDKFKPELVINIGGQDIKILFLDKEGNVEHFIFNDRCAAGTGRFFETLARILEVDVATLSEMGFESNNEIEITSTCVVFAENEIVNLLSEGHDMHAIVAGFNQAVACRIKDMIGTYRIPEHIIVDGGVALNQSFIKTLKEVFEREVYLFNQPQITTAIGAAIVAHERLQKNVAHYCKDKSEN